jgi:hypothetical protein
MAGRRQSMRVGPHHKTFLAPREIPETEDLKELDEETGDLDTYVASERESSVIADEDDIDASFGELTQRAPSRDKLIEHLR